MPSIKDGGQTDRVISLTRAGLRRCWRRRRHATRLAALACSRRRRNETINYKYALARRGLGHGTLNLGVTCLLELKCADTTGTVPVPWAGHFQC